jgi:hypothetical protein
MTVIASIGLGLGSASAASNSLKTGSFGFNVGFGDSALGDAGTITITGKYFS